MTENNFIFLLNLPNFPTATQMSIRNPYNLPNEQSARQ